MTIILCIDNQNGIAFNHRRQSRDRYLIRHIMTLIGSHLLWMDPSSKMLFTNYDSDQIIAEEDYLEKAGPDDYCFVETDVCSSYLDQADRIILFKWNRDYPADVFLTADLSHWTLEFTEDFPGHSHETITKESYRR